MFASGKTAAVASAANYIEDVFSTYLYTGNSTSGGTQTITNSIDLSAKGGMVWIKGRSAASDHILTDTTRGAGASATNNNALASNLTSAEDLGGSSYDYLSSFSTTGFVVTQGGTTTATRGTNYNNVTYASWTFRKQPKFFDIVTYTGNGTGQNISHNLGSTPACIILKRVNLSGTWPIYHRSLGAGSYVLLNTDAASNSSTTYWNNTSPTSTVFTVGSNSATNAVGELYVAYLFAHDAGGFGLSGSDNVISCGSYTGNGADPGPDINLGYEAQWVLIKNASDTASWRCFDVMRGMPVGAGDAILQPNSSAAESTQDCIRPTATGFQLIGADQAGGVAYNVSGNTYIYIAIRRGPMKVPTSGTSVFDIQTYTGTQVARTITTANTVDLSYTKSRDTAGTRWNWTDRLRGATRTIDSSLTAAEASDTTGYTSFAVQKGYTLGTGDTYDVNTSGRTYASWNLSRAPSFFDEVCYNGTSATTAFNHNLSVAPELIIVKRRNGVATWPVGTLFTASTCKELTLDTTNSATNSTYSDYFGGQPTSTTFTMASSTGGNLSGSTYVAYLFASCPGVSKVGSYTGTGTTLQVDCGFTGGARFVLIKRTDSTGDWYVWDSARGIVSGNDSYLLLNSTAAEVTNTDYIDTYSAGFEISSTAPAAINASGGSFIFLAIS